jgi:hypothetical protein
MCKTLTMKEWQSRGEELFGKDKKNWKFKCVNCGEVQSYHDFKEAGVENPENYVYFSCIGRFVKSRGCDWTLGGLFQLHKQEVIADDGSKVPTFEFAT